MTSSPDSPESPESSFPIHSHETSRENIVATPTKSNAPGPSRGFPDADHDEATPETFHPPRILDRTDTIPVPVTSPSGRPTLSHILDVVSDFYKLPRSDLVSCRRTRRIVRPRQVAMTLARELTMNSTSKIGQRFGGRDHSTVIHGTRKIATLSEEDQQIASDLAELRSRLSAPVGGDEPPPATRPRSTLEAMHQEILAA